MWRTVLVLAVLARLVGAASAGPLVVRYHDDRLTVRADAASLRDVLDRVATESGMRVGGPVDDRAVTADFEDVPLAEALRRVLGDRSFAVAYDATGPRRLVLGDEPAAVAATPAVVAVATAVGGTTPPAVNDVVIPVRGQLARRLGVQSLGARELLDVATRHEDPDVRRRAMSKAMRVISRDPVALGLLFKGMGGIDVQELAHFARANGGSDAEELVKSAIAGLRDPALRDRARDVLRELHPLPGVSGG